MRRALITGRAPSAPPALRHAAQTGGTTVAATSTAVTFTSTAANSLQILLIGYSRGATGNPTITVTGSGWVDLGGFQGNVATLNSGCRVFARAVTAGETGVTINSTNAITITWTVEEWLNIDTSVLPVGPAAPFTFPATTSTSAQNVNSNNRVTAADNELVWSFIAGRAPAGGTMGQTFGGGATASNVAASGRAAVAFTGYQVVPTAATSVTHTMQYTNTQGSANTVYGSISFKAA